MPPTIALALALVALAATALVWALYMRLVHAVRVPRWPLRYQAAMLAAGAAAGAALPFVRPRYLAAPAVVAIGAAVVFLFLTLASRMPRRRARAGVGEPLPAFSARRPDGSPFDSRSLQGKRVLLKVFRGFW